MTTELINVPFHDEEVMMIEHNGEPYVPVKPISDRLGLEWSRQRKKLRDAFKRFPTVLMYCGTGAGEREMTCLPLRKLPAWLFSINANKVRPDLKADVIRYQNECDDVLWRHWSGELHHDLARLKDQNYKLIQHCLMSKPVWSKVYFHQQAGIPKQMVWRHMRRSQGEVEEVIEEMEKVGVISGDGWFQMLWNSQDQSWEPEVWPRVGSTPSLPAPIGA